METKTEPVELKYEIGEEIGKGKFATVKRCRERQTGCEYAAKFIRKNRGTGRRGAKMENIEKEIQILKETNHRNIINLYEVYDTKREVILILELVDGGELFEYLSEKDKLSEEEASSFVRQILDGVEHLHARDIAHLDLKPENILLQDKNSTSVKLIDFGLSRKILPKEDHRAIMGTAEFCAPEVISFEPLSVSTDMWSIGVITYILLSGLSPFLGDNQQDTYHNITSINFEFDEEYFNGTSELAKDFIKKLLVKDTRKRATIYDCLNHPWIQPVEKRDKVLRRSSVINTEHLKKFMARQRWRRSMKVVSLCNRLSRSMQLRRIQSTDTLGSASEEEPDVLTKSVKQEDEVDDNIQEDNYSCENFHADVTEEQISQDVEDEIIKIPIIDTTKTATSEMAVICGQYTAWERQSSTVDVNSLESANVNSIGDVWCESLEKNVDNNLTENIETLAKDTAAEQEMSIENDNIKRRHSGDAETNNATAGIVFEDTLDVGIVETAREGQPSTAEFGALESANDNSIRDVWLESFEKDVDNNLTENIEPFAKDTDAEQEMSIENDNIKRKLSGDAEANNATAGIVFEETSDGGIVETAREGQSSTAEFGALESANDHSIRDVWLESLEKDVDNNLTENIEPVANDTAAEHEMTIENNTIVRRLSDEAETNNATAGIVFKETSDGGIVETAREGQPSTAEFGVLESVKDNSIRDVWLVSLEKDVDNNLTENIEPVANDTAAEQEITVENNTIVRRLFDDAESNNATAGIVFEETSGGGNVESAREGQPSSAEFGALESAKDNSIRDVWLESLEKDVDSNLTENIEPVAKDTAAEQEMSIENDNIKRRLSGDAETNNATAGIVFEETSDGGIVETAREGQPFTAEYSALESAKDNRIGSVLFESLEKDVDNNLTENIEPVAKEAGDKQEMGVEKDTIVRRLSGDVETCSGTAGIVCDEHLYEGIGENIPTQNLNKNDLTAENATKSAASEHQGKVRTDVFKTAEISGLKSSEIHDQKIEESPLETDKTFDSGFAETSDVFDTGTSGKEIRDSVDVLLCGELSRANGSQNSQESEIVRRITAQNFEFTEMEHDSKTLGNVETGHTETANENSSEEVKLQQLEVLENIEILENTEVEQLAVDCQANPEVNHTQLECNADVGEFGNDIGQDIKITDYEGETDHVSNVSFSLDQNDGRINHQSLCDEKMAYKDLPHRIADTNLDIIAQELVTKIIGQSLELVLNEASSRKKALTAGFSLQTPEDSNEQEADVKARQTIPEHKINMLGQLPEPKRHVKKYDPLHLACFEVESADETEIIKATHRDGLLDKEEENDEDDLFKPKGTSKIILSARKTAVAGRRLKGELRMRKKATFWEMEDCCETKRYEMFEMQVLNNSE